MKKITQNKLANIKGGSKACDFIEGAAVGASVVQPELAPTAVLVFGVASWYCSAS